MWIAATLILAVALISFSIRWKKKFREHRIHISDLEVDVESLRMAQGEMTMYAQREQLALINNMMEGVLLLNANLQVELVNPLLEVLLDIHEEFVGKNILEIIRLPQFAGLLDDLEHKDSVLDYELEYPGTDSKFLRINATVIPAHQERPKRYLLVFHDLTRIRELENTRQEFVANVSHELRTPLSMIKGYIETLLDGAKEHPETRDKFLKTIDRNVDRLSFLIEDLLTLSQLESGGLQEDFKPVNLSALVKQVYDDLSSKGLEKSVRLDNRLKDDILVSANSERISQVLYNLLDNAIKYGKPETNIVVDGVEKSADEIEVSIRNEGASIPEEAQERIFERFFRVDTARSRDQGGTGLGLSIVKHIVQSHGGKVRVESAPNQGATFFFTLKKG